MSVRVRSIPAIGKELQLEDEPWTEVARDRFIADDCVGVLVGSASLEYEYADIDFVADLPGLRSIRAFRGVLDCSAAARVEELRILRVHSFYRGVIPFSGLRGLHELEIPFPGSVDGLAELHELRSLHVFDWPKSSDLTVFGDHPHLDSLRLEFKRTAEFTTGGLSGMPGVRKIWLYGGRIVDVTGLSALTKVRELRFEGTKIPSLDFVPAMPELTTIELANCGPIDSLAPLTGARSLRSVALSGNTVVVDGDLSPLLDLPESTTVAVERGAPHYNHRPADARRSQLG